MRLTLPLLIALTLALPGLACAGSRQPSTQSGAAEADPGSERVAANNKKKQGESEMAAKPSKKSQTGMNGAAADFDSFKKAWEQDSKDPWKAADLFVQALAAYVMDQDTGYHMISLALPQDDQSVDSDSPTGFKPSAGARDSLSQLDKKPDIMKGYCKGTLAGRYEDADLPNCRAVFDKEYSSTRQGVGYPKEGRAKFFVVNGGSSRPRPVELEVQDDGTWRVVNWGGLLTGVGRVDD